MRIRSVKPEFWRSKTIADLSWDARLVLKGLESYVDDNGVGKYDLELIISDVFSRDHYRNPRETVARVTEAISELVGGGLVIRYQVDGEELLYIDKWKDIQRVDKPNSGRYRRPDGTLEYAEVVNRDSYRKPREGVANDPEILPSVTGEQGSRGTEVTGEQCVRDSAQRAQPNFGEMLRGTPDPTPDPPPIDAEVLPVSATNTRRDAERLVRENIPNHHPKATLTELTNQTNALLRDDQPEDVVAAGLHLWTQKKLHPKTLPSLCSEVINGRASPGNVTAFDRKKAINHEVFKAVGDQPNNPELLA